MNSKYFFSALSLITMIAYGSGADYRECETAKCCDHYPFFLQVSSGYSWSMCANICAPYPDWDKSLEGYNGKLCSAPVFQAGLGYYIRPWLATSVTTAYRGTYHYKKHLTTDPASSSFAVSGAKTRYFDLENMNIMFNLIANGANHWAWHFCHHMSLAPMIAAGIGISHNKISNFHSVLDGFIPGSTTNSYVQSIMTEKSDKFRLGAHADIGVAWVMAERAQLNLGYRFYYGGKFQSNNFTVDVPVTTPQVYTRPTTADAWCGTLKANELFVDLNINF